jgi:hypothetical protein
MQSDSSEKVTFRVNALSAAIGAIITALLTFGGTWLYGVISDKEPKLTYRLTESPPLPGSLANSAVYAVEVVNRGEREAINVRLDIRFGQGELLEESLNTPQGMEFRKQVTPTKNSYLFTSPLRNPGDRVTGSFLVRYTTQPSKPTIGLRAKGVNGLPVDSQSSSDERRSRIVNIVNTIAAAIGAIVALLVFLRISPPRILRKATTSR